MATQPTEERTANPLAVIRQNLQQMAPEFKAALPAHVTVEKFTRVAQTAIQNTPALVNADRRSLFGAFVRLAQDGLLPDGREAAVVMFGNKAQAMPMIAGVLKKIRQSGEVAKVSAQVVYANDKFVVKYGFDEDVEHIPPALNEPRGDPIGAYATAVLKDGSQMLEVMSMEEIEKVRSVSRAARNGPWVQWWGEMARKTVMRRLAKRLPMSTDLEDEIFARDETMRTPMLEAVAEPSPEPERPVSRLDAIEHQITEPDPPVEPEVIAEQAEELEAEIEEPGPDDEPDSNTNDADNTDAFGLKPIEKTPAEQAVEKVIAAFDAAKSSAELEQQIAAAEPHKKAMPDDLQVKLELAISRNRKRFEPAQGELVK